MSEIEPSAVFTDADNVAKKSKNIYQDSVQYALRLFDYHMLSSFLSKGLIIELDQLKNVLNTYTKEYNATGKVYLKERFADAYSTRGTTGYTRFTHSDRKIGSLELMYTYTGKRPIINEIFILRSGTVVHTFPTSLSSKK